MTSLRAPPAWLAPLQDALGEQLQQGLDPRSGTFETPKRYPDALRGLLQEAPAVAGPRGVSADERLALYHRQYWMRLFVGMQSAFPRTARVVGHWTFNHLADLHLRAQPPAHWDLDRAGDSFAERLLSELARVGERGRRGRDDALGRPDRRRLDRISVGRPVRADPLRAKLLTVRAERGLLQQALRLDEADRACFLAPWTPPWVPSAGQLRNLAETTLRLAPSVQVLRLDWDLHGAEVTDAPLASPRGLVLSRTEDGSIAQPVPIGFARVLRAGDVEPFGVALETARAACSARELAELKEHLPRMSNLALQRGWWLAR